MFLCWWYAGEGYIGGGEVGCDTVSCVQNLSFWITMLRYYFFLLKNLGFWITMLWYYFFHFLISGWFSDSVGLRPRNGDDTPLETNAFGKLVAGSLSGLCSKVITYPFDLARKRIQIQEFQHARVGFGSVSWR